MNVPEWNATCRNCGGGPQFGHQDWCGTAPGKRSAPDPAADTAALLAELGAVWSPDLGAYVAGVLDVRGLRCALCQHAPCDCPPFGTPGYFALIDARHGRQAGAS